MKERGAALLEFAMALPFTLTVFLGIGDFSVYFWRQTQMEDAARLTVSKIATALPRYASADTAVLHSFSQTLQEEVRSGGGRITIVLTKHYACPFASGAERDLTFESQRCPGERVYLRVVSEDAVEPLLGLLRAVGFPKSAFSRHVMRIQ